MELFLSPIQQCYFNADKLNDDAKAACFISIQRDLCVNIHQTSDKFDLITLQYACYPFVLFTWWKKKKEKHRYKLRWIWRQCEINCSLEWHYESIRFSVMSTIKMYTSDTVHGWRLAFNANRRIRETLEKSLFQSSIYYTVWMLYRMNWGRYFKLHSKWVK